MKISAILLALLLSSRVAQAANYYISTNGNDSNSCNQSQSINNPKATFRSATSCLTAGDTLFVRAGTYNQFINNGIASGTSWTNKVRIAAYQNEVVWLVPTSGDVYVVSISDGAHYIEFDGINVNSSNVTYGPIHIESIVAGAINTHHIRYQNAEVVSSPTKSDIGVLVVHPILGQGGDEFINLNIHGGGTSDFHHAIYLQAPDIIVDKCNISDWTGAGIQIYNGFGIVPNNITIKNTIVHDLRKTAQGQRHWGIIIYGSSINNSILFNNLVYNIPYDGSTSAGIEIYAQKTLLYNSTLYGGDGTGIQIDPGASGTTVINNISWKHTTNDYVNNGTGTIVNNNLIGVDPLFIDPTSGNFQIKDNSPAYNQGISLNTVPTDILGVSRPQYSIYDIGAYEYKGTTPVPPTPTTVTITITITCSPNCNVQVNK